MVYRQQIRPWALSRAAGQGWHYYDRIASARKYVRTGVWSNEDTYTMAEHLGASDKFGCSRGPYKDSPGVIDPPPGLELRLRYNMRFFLWDACQRTVRQEEKWTLDIAGTSPDFTITWTPGFLSALQKPPGTQTRHYVDPVLDR